MATATLEDRASSVVKPAHTLSPPATLADEVLLSARNYCRDGAAYDESAAKYGCSVCCILRPEVRVPHSCEHAICEPCAAECARLGKPCWCGEPFWPWEVSDAASSASSLSSSSSSSSSSVPSAYTHPSPVGSRALTHLVFSCPNACDRPTAIAFRDLVRHCTDDAACANGWVDCGDCKQRVRSLTKAAHARECAGRPVQCTACDAVDIRCCDLEAHYTQSCPKTVIHCPNGHCCVQLARDEMSQHLADTCLHQHVPCVMARFGCAFSGPRRLHDAHVLDDATQHLRSTVAAHTDLETSVGTLHTELAALADAFAKRGESPPTNRSDGARANGGDDTKSAVRETHGSESKAPTSHETAPASAISADTVPATGVTPPPTTPFALADSRWCAIDLSPSEMKRRLERLMLQKPTDRPAVLAADRYNAWYIASVVADTDPISAPAEQPVVAQFDGFRNDDEKTDLASGRVRPLFETPRDHVAFLDGLRPGDVIDCRVTDPIVWRWTPCTILWRHATEMGVRKRDCVRLNDVHVLTTTTLRTRCLPLGVASRLLSYSTDAFPPHTTASA